MSGPVHAVQAVASLAEATGGPARTIVSLSEALARRGAAVEIVASDAEPMLPDPALVGMRLVAKDSGFGATIRAARDARPGAATIVHDNGIWSPANYAVTRAARRLGLPYVITPHGMLEPWAMAYHRVRKQVAWAVYQRSAIDHAGALVATAPAERDAIRALFPRLPVAVIANGVAVPEMLPARPRESGESATLLFMSRIHPKKNLLGLVDAWAILAADPALAHWTLRIAGPDEGGHTEVVRARAEKLGIAGRVVLPGPIAEADKTIEFARADLFVLPSFSGEFRHRRHRGARPRGSGRRDHRRAVERTTGAWLRLVDVHRCRRARRCARVGNAPAACRARRDGPARARLGWRGVRVAGHRRPDPRAV